MGLHPIPRPRGQPPGNPILGAECQFDFCLPSLWDPQIGVFVYDYVKVS
jgi:hypothetical protein